MDQRASVGKRVSTVIRRETDVLENFQIIFDGLTEVERIDVRPAAAEQKPTAGSSPGDPFDLADDRLESLLTGSSLSAPSDIRPDQNHVHGGSDLVRHAGCRRSRVQPPLGPAKLRLQPFSFSNVAGDPIDPHGMTGFILMIRPRSCPAPTVPPQDPVLDIELADSLKVPQGLFSQMRSSACTTSIHNDGLATNSSAALP